MSVLIPCRLGLQQRVFPAYRAPFFDRLAETCAGGLSIFSGEPMIDEALGPEGEPQVAQRVQATNLYMGWGSWLVVWQYGIRRWLERWQPDVLITDTNPRNASTWTAIQWMHARNHPVIGWGLGAPPDARRFNPVGKALENSRRQFLMQFDALISYSETGAGQYSALGYPREHIYIAPNAVIPRPLHSMPVRPEGFSQGVPKIIFVGRLQARKRVDALLRSCAALPESLRLKLVIVGDGPARVELEALSASIYPQASFVGEKRGLELERLLGEADLFVLPGTGGLAVQQAMGAALPVLVAEADGTQSTLVRPENGWLLPPHDDAALTAGLAEALIDAARLRRMGRESYRIVVEEVNLERMVEVFAEVVNDARSRRR